MQDPRDPGTLDLVEACQRPLTGAERQKRRRDKLRELKEKDGLKPVLLTDLERRMLFAALEFESALKPFDGAAEQLRQELLKKICPASGSLADESAGTSPTGDRVLDEAFASPAHTGAPRESLRNLVLICTLRRRNSQHAELLRTVELFQKRLCRLGHSDALPAKQKNGSYWYWNDNPPIDYRGADPKGDHTPHLTAADEYFFRPAWMRE